MSVTISGEASASHKAQVNLDVAERYISGLKSLKEKFGLPGEITLESLTRIREIFLAEENGSLEDISFENIQQALEHALDNLEEMRRKEGKALFKDVSSRINEADSLVDQIKEKVPATVEEYRGRLRIAGCRPSTQSGTLGARNCLFDSTERYIGGDYPLEESLCTISRSVEHQRPGWSQTRLPLARNASRGKYSRVQST